jgi:hypothetical protein
MTALPREKFLFSYKSFVGRNIFWCDKLIAIPNKILSIFLPNQVTKFPQHKIVNVFTYLKDLKVYILSRISQYASSIGSLFSWISCSISSTFTRAAKFVVASSTMSTLPPDRSRSCQSSATAPVPAKSTNIASNAIATVADADTEPDDHASHQPTVAGALPPATAAFISLSRRHPCYFALGSIQSVGNMSTLLAAATNELQVRGGS